MGALPVQVTLKLPNAQAAAAPVEFRGQHEASRDDLDCVAVFDGSSFTIEQVTGQVKNLR